ncbi:MULTISPECIES: hypothetical protein [unclassified Streptomyces]|uniref:hypothetical protein n=1 Tax=unclassified Streptomyces TaxID=2593676 RepID=UPI0038191ADD
MCLELDRSLTPRRRTGVAGFFTRHVNGRLSVLLTYDEDRWRLPGGDTETDEFMHEAFMREMVRKTGLPATSPEEILVVDHVPRGVTEAEGIDVVFKGGEIPIGTDPGPAPYRWATLQETNTLCPAPEHDRIHSAHEAWRTGRTAYLICGERFSARPLC